MTHNKQGRTPEEIKAIIDGGEYCIQCPNDYKTNQRWHKFVKSCHDEAMINRLGEYYSPTEYKFYVYAAPNPESKTVLTLDEWWSVMGDEQPTRYTIKDLSEGRCAVVNDGTVEELREVLEEAFPEWRGFNRVITPSSKVVYASSVHEIDSGGWWLEYETTLPTQSIKLFIEELRGEISREEYESMLAEKFEGATAWQPKEGEMVEVSDDGKGWVKRVYVGNLQGWNIVAIANGDVPVGYKHIRPIQTIPVTLDDLKAAYAEKHNVDVNKITVTE